MSYNRDKILPDWRIIMDKEEYRKKIIEMVKKNEDINMLMAVYPFIMGILSTEKEKGAD